MSFEWIEPDSRRSMKGVLAAERVRECAFKSVSIAWVRKHAEPVPFSYLAATIERVGRGTTSASA